MVFLEHKVNISGSKSFLRKLLLSFEFQRNSIKLTQAVPADSEIRRI
jgi:hypothetical protein